MNQALEQRLHREIRSHCCNEAFVFFPKEIEYVKQCNKFEILRETPEGYLYITWKED